MTAFTPRRQRAGGGAAAALTLALLAGCGKKTESLVLVSLTTATPSASASDVTLTVSPSSCQTPPCPGSVSYTFTVPALSSTPVNLGLYVPESVTGPVDVKASVDAHACAGYDGAGDANIPKPGVSVGASITLTPALRCNCRELDHLDAAAPACDLAASPTVSNVYITAVAFSPDGKSFVAVGDDGRATVWRFDGTDLTPEGHVLPIDGGGHIAFSPDGKLMAAVSWSAPANPVAIYDVPAFTLRQMLTGTTDYTVDVGFTPDSQHVIVLQSDNLGNGSFQAYSLVNGSMIMGSLGGLDPIQLAVSKVATSGIQIAVAGADGRAGVFTYTTSGFTAPNIFRVTSGDTMTTWTVTFSPDGSLLAAGGEDAAFNFWASPFTATTMTGAPLTVAPDSGVNGVAFSPDGEFVGVAAGSVGREVSFWNVGSRTKLASYTPAYVATSIAFAPDGRSVAGGELYCGKLFVCSSEMRR